MSRLGEWISGLLLEERLVGYLDPGMEEVLTRLNTVGWLETTSSCSGRVTVVEGEWPWERRSSTRIVFKSHTRITGSDLAVLIARGFSNLWLKVTAPILHARMPLACVAPALQVARASGFKHSGVISIDYPESEAVVEFTAPTSFTAPLVLDGVQLATGGVLDLLAGRASRALAEGRARLARLVSSISSLRCSPRYLPGVGGERGASARLVEGAEAARPDRLTSIDSIASGGGVARQCD